MVTKRQKRRLRGAVRENRNNLLESLSEVWNNSQGYSFEDGLQRSWVVRTLETIYPQVARKHIPSCSSDELFDVLKNYA